MIQMVRCTQCGEAGTFDVRFLFTAKDQSCGSCGHLRESVWEFHFCTIEHFRAWLSEKDILIRGVPCQDCVNPMEGPEPTGCAFGFKTNGPCGTCAGQGRLRVSNPGPLRGGSHATP